MPGTLAPLERRLLAVTAEEVVEAESLAVLGRFRVPSKLSQFPCLCPEPWPALSDDDSWRSQDPAEEVVETESLAAAGPARGPHETVVVSLSLPGPLAPF